MLHMQKGAPTEKKGAPTIFLSLLLFYYQKIYVGKTPAFWILYSVL